MTEHLPGMYQALGSIPSPAKKNPYIQTCVHAYKYAYIKKQTQERLLKAENQTEALQHTRGTFHEMI